MPTLLQLSDLHMDEDTPEQRRRIDEMRRQVDRAAPDAIVFTGDVVDRGPAAPRFLEPAKALLDSLGPPVFVVPGNHDVGNKVSLGEHVVTAETLANWKHVFEIDRFTLRLGGWLIVGLNSQVTGSDLPDEAEQLAWLDKQLADAEREHLATAVFLHMPVYLSDPEEDLTGRPNYWQVDPMPRRELLKRLRHPRVRLVGSGHVHWHATFNDERPMRIWSPAIYSIVTEPYFPPGGDCRGMMRYRLDDDRITPELIRLDE